MNPLEYRGPDFLLFFLAAFVALVVLRAVVRWLSTLPGGKPESVEELGPYDVAYLAGGPQAVVHAAVASLVHRKRVTHRGTYLLPVAASPYTAYAPSETVSLHPFERAVEQQIGRGIELKRLYDAVNTQTASLKEKLRQRGETPSSFWEGARTLAELPGWGLWMLGVAKVAIGVSRDKPVAFLVGLLMISGVVWFATRAKPSYATRRGRATLAELKDAYVALQTTASHQPEQVRPDELALAYGLFGTAAFGGSLLLLGTQLFVNDPLWQVSSQSAFASSSGGSSFNSCGSSCGSSCGGGGCGGGCGGCGG